MQPAFSISSVISVREWNRLRSDRHHCCGRLILQTCHRQTEPSMNVLHHRTVRSRNVRRYKLEERCKRALVRCYRLALSTERCTRNFHEAAPNMSAANIR
jgi:hypothetical protein